MPRKAFKVKRKVKGSQKNKIPDYNGFFGGAGVEDSKIGWKDLSFVIKLNRQTQLLTKGFMMTPASDTTPRMNRTICMHFCQAQYYILIQHSMQFRMIVDLAIKENPELFSS